MKRINGEKCSLFDLKLGQSGKILEINVKEDSLKIHLLEMGLTPETKITIKKLSPFGEPVVIELRGYELFLEKRELKQILVEVI